MKQPAITGNRVNASQHVVPQSAEKNTALPAHHSDNSNAAPTPRMQSQQGQARAASLRLELEQRAAATGRKVSSTTGTVIKYAPDQRSARRQRAETSDDVMPLDEEIHHLNGSRRNVQQERKQVLAQRRLANRGFKNVTPDRAEHIDDLVTEGWGDDH